MALRSLALMLCIASLLGCTTSQRDDGGLHNAGHGGTGEAANLASASGQGGAAGTQAGMGSPPAGGAGGAGAGGAAAAAGGASGDDPETPVDAGALEPTADERAAADQATLLACDAPEPCTETHAGATENQHGEPALSEYDCLLTALSERTPGLYRHGTSHSFTNGSWQARHAILVQEDGSALYTLVASGSYAVPPDWESTPIGGSVPGTRCELKPASYFEACRAAMAKSGTAEADLDSMAQAWSCASGGAVSAPAPVPWLGACEAPAALACE